MIEVAKIRTDGGTQSRAAINEVTVAEYAEAMADPNTVFPPVIVYHDGNDYWLADGFHRLAAWGRIGRVEVPAEVRQGDRRMAILHSVAANSAHGLRRTNDDKRRAVLTLLEDDEWSQWSNREIARRCAVSEGLVRSVREAICVNTQMPTERTAQRGGTTYSIDTSRIGQPAQEPEPDRPTIGAEPEPVQEPTEPAAADPTPADGGRQEVIPPPPADPNAKLRAEFRAMTAEGQADDWIGLRLEVADLRKRVKAQRGEIADLKAEIKVLTEGDDMGRKLGALLRERDTLKGRISEHLTTIKRLEYRLKKIEGEEISL